MLSPLLLSFGLQVLLLQVAAAPAMSIGRLRIPPINPKKFLCQLPMVDRFLCPEGGLNSLSRITPIGTASGVLDPDGAHRYPVKYASASRWAPSTLVNTWSLPNGGNNVSALPLACPQPNADPSVYTEDCLSIVLYVPPSLTPMISNVPVLVWLHGGSFVFGSATGAGLDGSKLALATDSIVAVVQYRLGALGFLAPNGNTNLAVKDVVNALQFLKNVAPSFGGSSSKITLAGQSSGAHIIRTLLAAPSANSLFRSAILQSDPMNFGLLRPANHQALLANFTGEIGCNSAACQNDLSLSSILNTQSFVFNNSIAIDPATGNAEPIRPVLDGSFITTPLDSTGTFPSVSKPLLVTSVLHEAAFAIYKMFDAPIPQDWFAPICAATFGPDRTTTVVSSPYYPAVASATGEVDSRAQLEVLGTDYLWKCSGWTFARTWVQNGGSVYVGQFVAGASYPGNEVVPLCTSPGVVCHQDDIQIVFGTASNPTAAQTALIDEVQKRYKAFLNSGNPNADNLPTWQAATTSDVHAIQLGGSGLATVGACDPSFWGASVEYDYQFYNP